MREPIAHSDVEDCWEMRTLEDGSTWEVDKRHFTPERPLAKLGGGDVLLAGDRCVVVVSPR